MIRSKHEGSSVRYALVFEGWKRKGKPVHTKREKKESFEKASL